MTHFYKITICPPSNARPGAICVQDDLVTREAVLYPTEGPDEIGAKIATLLKLFREGA